MESRLRILRVVLFVLGLLLLVWWPLSHWLYSVWYHALMGFENPAQYADNALVRVVGLTGFFPVLLLFFAALNPLRNRDIVIVLIIYGVLGGCFTSYLIESGQFPRPEYLNVLLYFGTSVLLLILFPWKYASAQALATLESAVPPNKE